jgi:A118 family predicted phage portal protein
MFNTIIQFIKGVWKMLTSSTIKQNFGVESVVSTTMSDALTSWSNMYKNESDWLTTDIKSLNLAAAIASEIARAVTIEMEVMVEGSARADFLAAQLVPVLDRLRVGVEKGCALGGLMLKPYIRNKSLVVDFVQADQFYPISFDQNGNITSCVFTDQKQTGNAYYTRLEYHAVSDSIYTVRNLAFRSTTSDTLGTQVPLESVAEWADIQPEATISGVEFPLYAYFKYPLANNIDTKSPLGVSCYSRAVELIEQADKQWSNLMWEFESGKRAIYVDALAFTKDTSGYSVLPDKRLYRAINGSGNMSDEDMFHEWSPEFREAAIRTGLDAILKRIEFNCGLAYGTLSDPQSVDKTATEIVSAKQRSQATITDTQKALEDALEALLYAMDIWATLGNLAPRGAYQTTFDFDDSLIVDKDVQFQQDMRLVTQGLMSKVEFRMRNFGEDIKTATEKIAAVKAEQPEPADLFAGA